MYNERIQGNSSFSNYPSKSHSYTSGRLPAVVNSGSYQNTSNIAQTPTHGHESSQPNQQKSHLVKKVQALFPYLNDILGQNDLRSNNLVSKLVNLRDNLDGIF